MSRLSGTSSDNIFAKAGGEPFDIENRKHIPHEFVLDAMASLSPWTRSMFGSLAVYVEDRIMLVLRDKPAHARDNGVWLATTHEHHESLLHEFPNMRSIQLLGKRTTGWQILPADAPDFEQAALRACELIVARDPRIGKLPGAKRVSVRKTRREKPSARTKKAKRVRRRQSGGRS